MSIKFINEKSEKYGLARNYSAGDLCSWIKGSKTWRGKETKVLIPKWVLIEITKAVKKSLNNKDILGNTGH